MSFSYTREILESGRLQQYLLTLIGHLPLLIVSILEGLPKTAILVEEGGFL